MSMWLSSAYCVNIVQQLRQRDAEDLHVFFSDQAWAHRLPLGYLLFLSESVFSPAGISEISFFCEIVTNLQGKGIM